MSAATCSTCGRAIIWATTSIGSKLPLDARPAIVYRLEGPDADPRAVAVKQTAVIAAADLFGEEHEEGVSVYVSHFLTCPQAAQHSRSRK